MVARVPLRERFVVEFFAGAVVATKKEDAEDGDRNKPMEPAVFRRLRKFPFEELVLKLVL